MSHSALYGGGDSRLGQWLIDRLCKPVVERLPHSLHPNTISLANFVLCWLLVVVAVSVPYLTPLEALLVRLTAAMGLLLSTLLDCIDGMHARKTGQCSKLGEVLDHGLDAANIPLGGALVILILDVEPILTAVAMVTTGLIYNAQLVYYHHKGEFVPPQVSGVSAQVSSVVVIISFGLLIFFAGRQTDWVALVIHCFGWGIVALSVHIIMWYVWRLKAAAIDHAKMVVLSCASVVLYQAGLLDTLLFVTLFCCLSFRVTGRFVLASVLGDTFRGWDWGAACWLTAIGLAGFAGPNVEAEASSKLTHLLAIAACLWFIGANIADILRRYDQLGQRE